MGQKAAVYVRVSTASQKPDLRRDGVQAFAERAGLEIVAEYVDRAISRRRKRRPELSINAIRASIDGLVNRTSAGRIVRETRKDVLSTNQHTST